VSTWLKNLEENWLKRVSLSLMCWTHVGLFLLSDVLDNKNKCWLEIERAPLGYPHLDDLTCRTSFYKGCSQEIETTSRDTLDKGKEESRLD